jgi:hypothetical protein
MVVCIEERPDLASEFCLLRKVSGVGHRHTTANIATGTL